MTNFMRAAGMYEAAKRDGKLDPPADHPEIRAFEFARRLRRTRSDLREANHDREVAADYIDKLLGVNAPLYSDRIKDLERDNARLRKAIESAQFLIRETAAALSPQDAEA